MGIYEFESEDAFESFGDFVEDIVMKHADLERRMADAAMELDEAKDVGDTDRAELFESEYFGLIDELHEFEEKYKEFL